MKESNMSLVTPEKFELLYDVRPDVFKSDVAAQSRLVELVKKEAVAKVSRGESLPFHLSVSGLCDISVESGMSGVPLPAALSSRDFVVKRKNNHTANTSPTRKHIEHMLLSEDTYPCEAWQQRYDSLVGLDEIKNRILTMLRLLLSAEVVTQWLRKHHPQVTDVDLPRQPYPVFVFEGSPGLGKTELGRSIGDPLARALGIQVVQYRVGLQVRGEGLVGQLGGNIFKLIEFAKMEHQQRGVPILLLIDEADAIGQSRDIHEQHQEERAGLNTLLQQIDGLRDSPGVALILTTNRPGTLDTALKERSGAHWITFPDSTFDVRLHLFERSLGGLLSSRDLQTLAAATAGYSPRGIEQLRRRAVIEAISMDSPLTKHMLLHSLRAGGLTHPSQANECSVSRKSPSQAKHKRRNKHAARRLRSL
jgi:SpoVK/Ycf46/Vps4 family AAA+-type ATPase